MTATSKTRSWLALGTSLLLVVMVGGFAGCGASSTGQTQPTSTPVPATATPLPPTGPVVTTPIVGISMFSATIGWAGGAGSVAYTVDGGHTWYDVNPHGVTPPAQCTFDLYPMSATDAWTWLTAALAPAMAPPVSTCTGGSSTTLWYTTDAGSHWRAYTVPTILVSQLDFTDSLHGWLAASPPAAVSVGGYPLEIWRTTDGGATWANVASFPQSEDIITGISFANATTGFAAYASGFPLPYFLSVTHDGGSTWSGVSVPTPPGYSQPVATRVEPPVFTSASAGVLEVSYGSNVYKPLTLTVYRTTDTGTSWQLGPSLSGSDTGGYGLSEGSFMSSVLSSGEVFVAPMERLHQVTLYQLPLGATSWTKINTGSSSMALLSGITQLDFVNPTTGWAVTNGGPGGRLSLIGTTNGGVTWTLLHA